MNYYFFKFYLGSVYLKKSALSLKEIKIIRSINFRDICHVNFKNNVLRKICLKFYKLI